jgi:hypothetical protein
LVLVVLVLLVLLGVGDVVSGLLVDSSQVVEVGFEGDDLLSALGEDVLGVSDGFVLGSDFQSEAVSLLVEVLVDSFDFVSFQFEFLDESFVLISSLVEFSDSLLQVVNFGSVGLVVISESGELNHVISFHGTLLGLRGLSFQGQVCCCRQ